MKPKLLIVELWNLGDLVLATPFLREASRRFHVTLLAKSFAVDLSKRLWPDLTVVPFKAPWTAFKGKYRLHAWPWKEIFRLRKLLAEPFDIGLSARWDPRDHLLLWLARVRTRLGFPRVGSQCFLTTPLTRPDAIAHRYEHWRVLGRALGFELPPREQIVLPAPNGNRQILVHTGAGQPVRVWPLPLYRALVGRLRAAGLEVQVACDPDQRSWWVQTKEPNLATPTTIPELLALIDRAGAFIGNDSGPGHLAAFCGVPTFTIFGPQLPEWFAPLHPASAWVEGLPCPFKPCSDYCRFDAPHCLQDLTEDQVWEAVNSFLSRSFSLWPSPEPSAAVPITDS